MIVTNRVFAAWNELPEAAAAAEILPCCGSTRWAQQLAQARPFAGEAELFDRSDAVWLRLDASDWNEAFRSHPRIGERKAPPAATQRSAAWSDKEQSGISDSGAEVLTRLAEANRLYEERFGRIFLICATGKSAAEMLTILERRLENAPETELLEAVEQQRRITQLRLRKWLHA
jgi:2-oxo-4-hydroxy-4-carboxy-5-ureidoimidazoline decarboxylase